jgi:Protein-disulfide isomerase
MNKRLWVVFGIIIVAILSLVVYTTTSKPEPTGIAVDDVEWTQAITKENIPEGFSDEDIAIAVDNITGKVDSDVVFIEWFNFQCSACQSLFHTLDDIYNEYSDRVAFVNRYLYLTGHPNGLASTVAAEAAARQGKYHEMHREIFSNAELWNNATIETRESIFRSFAEKIDLDVEQWTDDYKNYENNGIKKRLDFQNKLGLENGVTGSPFLIVNGEKVSNKKESIREALDKALEAN